MSNHHYSSGPQPPWALRGSNLHLGDELHHQQHHQQDQQQSAEQQYAPWPVPNPEVMAERWRHRHHVLGETAAHLLVHPHGGLGVTGRNVVHVLHDRHVRGPAAITCRAHWKRSHNLGTVHQNAADLHHEHNSNNNNNNEDTMDIEDQDSDKEEDSASDERGGSESNMPKSPSTVLLETSGTEPMETTTTTTTTSYSTAAHDVSQVSTQLHTDAHLEDETPQPPPFYKDQVLSDYFQNNNNSSNNNNTNSRFLPYPMTVSRELRTFGEYAAATKYHSAFLTHLGGDEDTLQHRPASSRAVSTISVAFSPDGRTLASTHGDHTVKISCCETGRLCQSLEGHPRTPWTVKYHPTNADVVASGCLGHQVRVWNWREKICLQMVRLEFAIISLAFHPTGQLLAIANGTRLHFWGVGKNVDKTKENNSNSSSDNQNTSSNNNNNNTLLLLEMDHRHMLRCVHFPPGGDTLIIGGVNQENDARRRRPGSNGMSFYLRLWDFDLERTLAGSLMMMMGHNSGNGAAQVMPRGAISNSRTFVPRALLYNDGGFDISPDGKMLCACAEYWLPEGVDSAMELLVKDEEAYDAENREQEIRQRLLPSPLATSAATTASTDISVSAVAAAPPPPQFLGGAMTQSSLSASDTKSAVSAALANLRGIVDANVATHGRSGSFREGMDQLFQQQSAGNAPPPQTPTAMDSSPERLSHSGTIPRTPPVTSETRLRNLSPPPPPGNRFGGTVSTSGGQPLPSQQPYFRQPLGGTNTRGISSPPPPPPVPPQAMPPGIAVRPPNPLSLVLSSIPISNSLQSSELYTRGRYVPHVVTVSLDTSKVPDDVRYIDESGSTVKNRTPCAVARGYRPRLGQLMDAHPLDANKAGAVTCVKFSPSTDFCLIGYGVREPLIEGIGSFHPVTAVFRVRGGMTHVSTTLSGDDDVNIARFHPDSGHSFVYGTKQGRVRVLSPRPWNFYFNSRSQPNIGG